MICIKVVSKGWCKESSFYPVVPSPVYLQTKGVRGLLTHRAFFFFLNMMVPSKFGVVNV